MNYQYPSKIISGGQTGADFGGLLAGKELNMETGGYAPKGYKTEKGPNPTLANYNVEESISSDYQVRTELNANESDATVWFGNTTSRGFKATRFYCKKYNKPFFIIEQKTSYEVFRKWLLDNKVSVLNVAGNRESKNPGIEQYVKNFLVESLS